jgi:hypothetical protein
VTSLATQPDSTAEARERPARDAQGRYLPGRSANPGGRPAKVGEVRAAAGEHSLEAIMVLAREMRSDDPMVRIAAAKAILDRAVGKPLQELAVGPVPVLPSDPITTAEQAAEIYAQICGSPTVSLTGLTFEAAPLPPPSAIEVGRSRSEACEE